MTKRDKKYASMRVTGYNNNKSKRVNTLTPISNNFLSRDKKTALIRGYSHGGDNNYLSAVIDGFELLSWRHGNVKMSRSFDMELCRMLVDKYSLSCSDCKIGECENYGLDQFR